MKERKAVVLDFDGTLTGCGTHLIDIVNRRLDGPLREELEELDGAYRPKAVDHTITAEEERAWGMGTFDAYLRRGLTLRKVRRALADIRVRKGVGAFLDVLAARGVPHAIVSYGFAPFIRIVLAQSGIRPDALPVFAAELSFDGEGPMTGYDERTYVLPEAKGDVSRAFADAHGVRHRDLLGVGDSSGDRFLGHLKKNRLGICESEERVPFLRPYFGRVMVLPDGDFTPAAAWCLRRVG